MEQINLSVNLPVKLPADHKARNSAVDNIRNNYLVEAAAGSGKTSAMVDRMISMILDGIPMQEIVAITFTNKSGAELKTRMISEITGILENDKRSTNNGAPRDFQNPEIKKLLSRALAEIDLASIGTIHSFCYTLLTLFWKEAGLSPSITLITGARQKLYLNRLHKEIVEELLENSEVRELMEKLSISSEKFSYNSLLDLVRLLDDHLISFMDQDYNLAEFKFDDEYTEVFHQLLDIIIPKLIEKFEQRKNRGKITQNDVITLANQSLNQEKVQKLAHEKFKYFLIDEFQDTDKFQFEIVLKILRNPKSGKINGQGELFLVGDPKQAIYHFRGGDLANYLEVKQRFATDYQGEILEFNVNFRSQKNIIDGVNNLFQDEEIWQSISKVHPDYEPLVAFKNESEDEGIIKILSATGLTNQEGEKPKVDDIREAQAELIANYLNNLRDTLQKENEDESKNFQFKDYAILVPVKARIPFLKDALDRLGIPYVVEIKSQLYNDSLIVDFLTIFRAIYTKENLWITLALKTSIFGWSDDDLLKYYLENQEEGINPFDYDQLEFSEHQDLKNLYELLNFTGDLFELSQKIIDYGNVIEKNSHNPNLFSQLKRFQNDLLEFNGGEIGEFIEWVDLLANDNDDKEVVINDQEFDAVTITNFHQAKGREWNKVIIFSGAQAYPKSKPTGKFQPKFINTATFLESKAYPSSDFPLYSIGWTKEIATHRFDEVAEFEHSVVDFSEQLRTIYVAFTRAKTELTLITEPEPKKNTIESALIQKMIQGPDNPNGIEVTYIQTNEADGDADGSSANQSNTNGGSDIQTDGGSPTPDSTLSLNSSENSRKKFKNVNNLVSENNGKEAKEYRADLRDKLNQVNKITISKHQNDDELGLDHLVPAAEKFEQLRKYYESLTDIKRPTVRMSQFGTAVHRALELSELNSELVDSACKKALDEMNDNDYVSDKEADEGGNLLSDEEFSMNINNLVEKDEFFITDEELLKEVVLNVLKKSSIIEEAKNSKQIFHELPLGYLVGANIEGNNSEAILDKTITAFADLVYQNEDGTWTIVDYKNSQKNPNEGEAIRQALTEYYRQLMAYKKILEEVDSKVKVSKLALVYTFGETQEIIWEGTDIAGTELKSKELDGTKS